jgi:glycosyltransferase involved in cell wall biosynthesis
MRVLILGEDAPGGITASYARAFAELGIQAETFCLARAYSSVMPMVRARVLRRIAEPVLLSAFNDYVVRSLRRAEADLVLVVKGHRLAGATIDALRDTTDAPVVNFYPDDPFSDERSNKLAHGPNVLASYDACFTFARHLIPQYEIVGARTVHYLPFARDPELHSPPTHAITPEFDVVFVGNLDEQRVRYLEAIADDYDVGVFGERVRAAIPRGSPLHRATLGPAAYGVALSQTLALGLISLNVMRPQNAKSHNMRSYESPACGAFTLSQRTPELTELFVENEEIACFDSVDSLRESVARWLADRDRRAAMARAAFERVREDTYARRAAIMLERAGVVAGAWS